MPKSNHGLPFNAQAISKASVRDGRNTEWRIHGVKGLVLVVTPAGAATYFVRYQTKVGKRRKFRRVKIGSRDATPLADARKRAMEIMRGAEAGQDPAAEKSERSRATTFRELCELRFNQDSRITESTRRVYRDTLQVIAMPAFGDYPARDITTAMIVAVLDKAEAANSPTWADKIKAVVSSMYRWAMERQMLDANPCATLRKRGAKNVRKRVLSDDELAQFWHATGRDDVLLSGPMRTILRLAVVTGKRRAEIAGARVAELHLEGHEPTWTIPGDTLVRGKVARGRAKNREEHVEPLSRQAVELFREAEQLAGEGSEHLFPADMGRVKIGADPRRPHIHPESVSKAVRRLRETASADGEAWDVVLHDMRRVIATWLEDQLVHPHVIDRVLSHRPKGVTREHYSFAKLKVPMRNAMQSWADHVWEVTGQSVPASNVVTLRPVGATG